MCCICHSIKGFIDAKEFIIIHIIVFVVFVIPFIFMVLTAAKDRRESAKLEFSLPSEWRLACQFIPRDEDILVEYEAE